MFLKGQRWWWYAIALGLIVAQLSSSVNATHSLLVVAWTWPILILSGLGCRETRHNTRQIVFSAPRPLTYQLPAAWLGAFSVIALLGAGALVRFIFAGEWVSVAGWLTGALFIPSLALTMGVLTGSGKTFEIVYVLWMYLILQKVPALDFVGMTPEWPWYIYAPLALGLLALAAWGRRQHMRGK